MHLTTHTTHITKRKETSNSIKKKKEQRTKQTFFQRRHTDGLWEHDSMLSITNHQGNRHLNHYVHQQRNEKKKMLRMYTMEYY